MRAQASGDAAAPWREFFTSRGVDSPGVPEEQLRRHRRQATPGDYINANATVRNAIAGEAADDRWR